MSLTDSTTQDFVPKSVCLFKLDCSLKAENGWQRTPYKQNIKGD